MKTLALLFALSLYLLPNPTHSTFNPIRLRTADEPPVLDINGDEVRAGGDYYIVSAINGAGGGGLRLVRLDMTSKCASDVIVSPSDVDKGNRITITPVDPTATVVMQSTYQSFRFNLTANILCMNNVNWGIQFDSATGQYFLKAGEFNSVNSNHQFKIEVVNASLKHYKITYCQDDDKCYNVGRYHDPLYRITRLAISDSPFVFVILKAGNV